MAKRRRIRFGANRKSKKKGLFEGQNLRIAALYGLSGLFTLVVGGLFLVRPSPLAADRTGNVLAASTAVSSPLDQAFETNVPLGHWTSLTIRQSRNAAELRSAHFAIRPGNASSGIELMVGSAWLEQRAVEAPGELLLLLPPNADEQVMTAADRLVDRLRERLEIDAHHVRRS